MTFGKEFKHQKVPKWSEAYVDYNGLKRILREIQIQCEQAPSPARTLQQGSSLYTPFNGPHVRTNFQERSSTDIEDQAIAVETEDTREVGGQSEITFFKKLDEELIKVNTFYSDKVEGVSRQMNAFIAVQIKVEHPNASMDSSTKSSGVTSPSRIEMLGQRHLAEEHQIKMNNWNQLKGSSAYPTEDRHMASKYDVNRIHNCGPGESGSPANRGASITSAATRNEPSSDISDVTDVLDRVKINSTHQSPMSFMKEEPKEAEGGLKVAFIELYHKLHLLKKYRCYINLLAFSKIMKKYDKISLKGAATSYMKIVDGSFIGNSNEVNLLIDQVEDTFFQYLANSKRRQGMQLLRPEPRRKKHKITFFSGFFSGCSIALLIVAILVIQAWKIMAKEENTMYVENVFPLYSLYAYIVLHMLLYAANIYFWRRCRINYPRLFGFKQGTELSYQDVCLVSTGLAVLALATFLVHLHMKVDSANSVSSKYIELLPLGLLIAFLSIFLCPFNILYKSSCVFLIQCVFRCMCAPLYKGSLADYFLADQLTSQVQALRCLEFYICYYGMSWREKEQKCHGLDLYNLFYISISVIPYWIRFLQCVRRLLEEKDRVHLYNGARYFWMVIVGVLRTIFELKTHGSWKVLALVSSLAAIFLNTYWDIVVDWGLLQKNSKNLFLRDKLAISRRSVYFVVMVLDAILRLGWLQLVLKHKLHYLEGTAMSSLFSCLEIFRRGVWMFFRLENEQLNDIGKN